MGTLLLVQGLFYVVQGLWPIVHIKSFLFVTGPKTDLWLVKTVGLLITVIGLVLLSSRSSLPFWGKESFLLGCLSALSLAAIDVFYVAKGRISRVYLLDAFVELVFVIWWLVTL